jgi:RHS repeat-associated protein
MARLWSEEDFAESGTIASSFEDPAMFATSSPRNGTTECAGDTPHVFQGTRRDESTGMCYADARRHDRVAGSWINRDPGGFAMGDVNLYRAMGNALTDGLDPSGLETIPLNPPPPQERNPHIKDAIDNVPKEDRETLLEIRAKDKFLDELSNKIRRLEGERQGYARETPFGPSMVEAKKIKKQIDEIKYLKYLQLRQRAELERKLKSQEALDLAGRFGYVDPPFAPGEYENHENENAWVGRSQMQNNERKRANEPPPGTPGMPAGWQPYTPPPKK